MIIVEESKELYKKNENSKNLKIPVFQQSWWLEIVTNGNWNGLIFKKGDEILALATAPVSKSWMLTKCGLAKLSQFQGLYYLDQNIKKSLKIEIINSFCNYLNKFDIVKMSLNPMHRYVLPYLWNNYEVQLKNTYYINQERSNITDIRSNYSSSLKRNLKKAKKNLTVDIVTKYDEYVHDIFFSTFKNQGLKNPLEKNIFEKLIKKGLEFNKIKILVSKNEENKIVALIILSIDEEKVYYLGGGLNPKTERYNEAVSSLIDAGIEYAVDSNKIFDFEGSSIQGVERFFRSFGAKHLPYFKIITYKSELIKKLVFIKNGHI